MSQEILQQIRDGLESKTREELLQLATKTRALVKKRKYKFLDFVWPESGKFGRDKYKKVMDFYKAGKDHTHRFLGGGNGSGKTYDIGIEWVYHWTGLYPDWWEGKRLENPKSFWIIIKKPQTYKESIQKLLFGNSLDEETIGTGLIPKDCLVNWTSWPGAGSGIIQSFEIRHVKGHVVTIAVRSSEEDPITFAAANLDGVWYDEETRWAIYKESQARLRGSPTKPPGISIIGCTSLEGMTDFMLAYAPDGIYPDGQHPNDPQKFVAVLDLEKDCPHFPKESIEMYKRIYTGSELEARLRGTIMTGSGLIYPYPVDQVFVKPFPIPDYWPRCFGLDFGYHCTCALWAAQDPHTKTIYIYSEYYSEGHQTAQVHSLNIQAKGKWIPGICDPSGGGRQDDGRLLADLFRQCGLELTLGDNSMTGLARNQNMFENGSLKIFDTCIKTKREYQIYHWDSDKPGQPARNQKDHAMDTIKYITSQFEYTARTEYDEFRDEISYRGNGRNYDSLTGY